MPTLVPIATGPSNFFHRKCTILDSVTTHRGIPVRPPLNGRPRHMKEQGRVSDRPALINNQPRDAKPLNRSKSSISVRHENLRNGIG